MNTRSYKCCKTDRLNISETEYLSMLLKLVADPNRLKILCILKNGTHCVCEFEKHLHISQSLLSHHLADLRKAGLIVGEKQGLNVYYRLTEYGKKITGQIFNLDS